MCVRRYVHGDRRENVNAGKGSGCVEGSVNVMGRKGGNRLFPTLTLTLTFHHPEQSLLHKLHWLDHVIRVGARLPNLLTHLHAYPHYRH